MQDWQLPVRAPESSEGEPRKDSKTHRRQPVAEGSLSSAASSSGCSSVECSSTDTSRPLPRQAPPAVARRQLDYLPPESERRVKPMSEFSAASLRKSLRKGLDVSGERGDQARVQRALRRAATFRSNPPRVQADYCCCCSGDCRAVASFSFVGRRERPNRRVNLTNLSPARTHDATVALANPQQKRPQARRPLPVPPPVVPLYKEMALLDGSSAGETLDSQRLPRNAASSARDLLADVSDSRTERAPFAESYGENWRELGVARSCLDVANTARSGHHQPGETRTLGRRLLGRLKETLLAKCSAHPSTRALEQTERDPGPEPRGVCVEEPAVPQAPIYDTPEFNASGRGGQPAPPRRAPRPTIPPPPPPSQAQPQEPFARKGACAGSARSDLLDVSFESISSDERIVPATPDDSSSDCSETGLREDEEEEEEACDRVGLEDPPEGRQKVVKWAPISAVGQEGEDKNSAGGATGLKCQVKIDEEEALRVKKGILLKQLQRKLSRLAASPTAAGDKPPDQRMGAQSSDLAHRSADQTNGHVKLTSSDGSMKSLSLRANKLLVSESSRLKTIIGAESQAARGPKPTGAQLGDLAKLKARSSEDKAGKPRSSARPQSVSAGKTAASPFHSQQPLSIEDPLEKRRKSIQNGDVFIYPSLYKHLNECPKCLRDNRVCNCNTLDLWHDETSEPELEKSAEQQDTHSFRIKGLAQVNEGQRQSPPPQGSQEERQMKSVYKISIATAIVDQKSNQLRLSTATTVSPDNLDSFSLRPGEANPDRSRREDEQQPAARPRTTLREWHKQHQQPEVNQSENEFCEVEKSESSGQPFRLASPDPEASTRAPPGGAAGRGKSPKALQSSGAESASFADQSLEQMQKPLLVHSDPFDRNKLFLFSTQLDCNNVAKSERSSTSAVSRRKAKVTAISIGSPTRAPVSVDLEKVLSPLLMADRKDAFSKPTTDPNNNSSPASTGGSQEEASQVKCDTAPSSMDERRQESEAMLKGQIDSEKGLICNLNLSDTIKITSTSLRLAANTSNDMNAGLPDRTHTSVVPIQTLPSRRINSRLSRQVILEDDDSGSTNGAQRSQPLPNPILDGENPILTEDKSPSSDVFEYSPILSGVRDYIQNVNTKLQVQSASTSPIPVVRDDVVGMSSFPIDSSIVLASISQPIIASSEAVQTGLVQTSTGIVQTTAFTAVNKVEIESPKKSIFEGASKDEILEYLEDARERVPDILMAADDVMVINENELIVVNQLEPDSPATPISIVEAAEVIDGPKSLSSLCSSSETQTHPDKLRQHLQHMFRTSQLSSSLQCSSEMTIDEDNCTSTDRNDGRSSELESTFDSIDAPSTASNPLYCSRRVGGPQKSFSCISGATLGGLEDQVAVIEVPLGEGAPDSQKINLSSQMSGPTSIEPAVKYSGKSTGSVTGERDKAGLTSFESSKLFSARRNSLSEHSDQLARVCELRMMKFHKRYSNRDSVSSTSSTPPTSTSPSSSTSSNQMSGNCSAASTFYASSSLSCSSPLLATCLTPHSPAFYKSPVIGTTSTLKYENEVTPTYGVQILESLIREVKEDSSIGDAELRESSEIRDNSALGAVPDPKSRLTRTEIAADIKETSSADESNKNLDGRIGQSPDDGIHFNASHEGDNLQEGVNILVTNGASCKNALAKREKKSVNLNNFGQPIFSSSANLMNRTLPGHYASRLNNYFMNRYPLGNTSETTIEFQCLDCDQFIDVDQVTILNKTNEIRSINGRDANIETLNQDSAKAMSPDQLDRAYIAAMNGLPLCKSCEKKRVERKEIISEFVETELKYGRDLKIIHDEFYRPMHVAGLLSKEQIRGVFLNLEELIMAHCKFADRLETAISEAHSMGDTDYNTVNIGRLFFESAEMLHTFESYCIRQGSAACLLARLAKEKELLRIFLRVSQMENTLLRRMNLAAFLMVPVQRVTKYPLLLNRLYKVTAYHHKDREALRDAQLKVELHLEHINQQTKGVGATNKIWRRISNLSAPISNRTRLMNSEDIGYIKLRKTAMDMLKWDRDETQFIHSGRINFAPLNEFLIKQKMKPMRYIAAHAILVVLGKTNWKYRPDLVKSNLDNKLMTPTPGGNGVKEAALLLFREKNGRFVPCREPLYLSNCVLSADCSQFNSECPLNQLNHHCGSKNNSSSQCSASATKPMVGVIDKKESSSIDSRASSTDLNVLQVNPKQLTRGADGTEYRSNSVAIDALSMSSMKSLPEDQCTLSTSPPTVPSSRSYSLASALPRTIVATNNLAPNLTKPTNNSSSNLTILNQLMTKVNSYHKQSATATKANLQEQNKSLAAVAQPSIQPDINNQTLVTIESLAGARVSTNTSANVNSSTHHGDTHQNHYNHHYFHNLHHPYGDYEESFEIHERISKESMLLRADTPLKTRYWLQMLRYHAKDLGHWRTRRNALANIMMMRHE